MRKTIFFASVLLAASVAFLTGCAKEKDALEGTKIENDATIDPVDESLPGIPFELIAGTSEDTKTAMSEGKPVWEADNSMNVFYAPASTSTYSSNIEFTITSENLAANKFTGTLPGEYDSGASYDWYALYPYNSNISTPATTSGSNAWLALGSSSKSTNQTQTGNSSQDHLAGQYFPLYGKVTGVAGESIPSMTMKQALAVVRVRVTNSCPEPLLVSSVGFTAPEPVVGTFWMNITGEKPVFTKSGDDYVSNTASLTVSSGTDITTGGTADFYLAIKPITVAKDAFITVTINGKPKKITMTKDVVFSEGKIKTININYKDFVELDWTYPTGEASATRDGLTSIDGVTASGLGSDYAESNAPYQIKLDGTGDYIQVKTDKEISSVSVKYKMIGGASTSSLDIYESADGVAWGSAIDNLEISGSSNSTGTLTTSAEFASSSRYVKIYFNKGSNVGIGGITITTFGSSPRISANSIDVTAAGVTDAYADYTIYNFSGSDDVSVKSFTGCVTAATVEGGRIKYSVNPNYGTIDVAGTIVLQSAEASDKTVNVSQAHDTFTQSGASGSPLTLTIPSDASTASFTITSSIFGWNASVTPADLKNLTIKTGADTYASTNSGPADASEQTITVSSTTEAGASEQTLGTIDVYRNGNSSDSQKISITVKKASVGGGTPKVFTGTFEKITETLSYLTLTEPGSTEIESTISVTNGALGQNVDGIKGAQVGTSKSPATSIVITAPFTGSVSSITLNTSGASSVSATLQVNVGGTTYKSGGNESISLSSTATDYTFTGSASGTVTITITNSSAKAIYLKNLSITGVK